MSEPVPAFDRKAPLCYNRLMIREFSSALLDLIFPPVCIHCRSPLSPSSSTFQLCPVCRAQVLLTRPPFCLRCSRTITDISSVFCPVCRKQKHDFDQAVSCCQYNEVMKNLLHLFKYHHKTALKHFFCSCIYLFLQRYSISLQTFDCIVPVPLHPARFRERGYNQSLLIAQELSRNHNIVLSAHNLLRTRNTKSQTALSIKERWTNIQSAFTIKCPFTYKGKNVLIIDDLLTTGATTSEIAKTLKNDGAKKVAVLTLAIAS